MCPSPPAPITHAGRARVEQRDRLADRVVGGDAGVGQGGDVLRLGRGSSLTQARAEVSRYSAIPPSRVKPGERCCSTQCMSCRPGRPGTARRSASGAGSRCRRPDVGHRGADLVHPAGVLVADRVGQRRVHRRVPLALDDVQVGAADAGAADLDDTSSGPLTVGSGTSSTTGCWWYPCSRTAFMRLLLLALAAGRVAVRAACRGRRRRWPPG